MIGLKFSNFDVYTIVRELDTILSQGSILNLYEIDDLLILKIKTKTNEKRNLIIQNDARINITNYSYPIPKFPTQYIISFRKFMKNRKIISISQHNFDRIIIIELSNYSEEPWKFIIELFNKGNYVLLDENNIIKIANSYKKFRDRDILANREYQFPKRRGKDFLTLNLEEFKAIIIDSEEEVVRILARNISISGLYSEEICFRAGVEKTEKGKSLNEVAIQNLFSAFKTLRNNLLFGEIKANIVVDKNGNPISIQPFDLTLFEKYQKNYFNSFNEAVDEYYSKLDAHIVKSPHDGLDNQIKSQEQILKKQMEYLEELKALKKKFYNFGDFIYAHFVSLQKLFDTISDARNKGYSIEEINHKLLTAKNENIENLEFFIKIEPSTKQLVVEIDKNQVFLSLNQSLGENANRLYNKGKKYEKKLQGTIPAIEKTKKKIQRLKNKKQLVVEEIDFLIKKPKKKWYEKFRWFFTSEDLLVIGGRDANSNELIFKKHISDNDLVLHTSFPGSPLAIIKNPENRKITEQSIREAADFVASYSRAWKENWGVVDVFYIFRDQISKTPPSGEFLPKGSFMISGKKNFIKDAKTELAVGLKLLKIQNTSNNDEYQFFPKIIVGPLNAIKAKGIPFLLIKPSNNGLQKGPLAKEIKSYFIKISDKDLKKWIKLLTLDEIVLALPSGKSIIKN
ncbi:MAG: ribosome rescue protein RqcH [Candidatus Thorarchaeota archaeon]